MARRPRDSASARAGLAEPPRAAPSGLLPGLALAFGVAVLAFGASALLRPILPLPTMVLALIAGMLAYPVAARPLFQAGLVFCVRHLLRWAVALLGLRIALGDIVALGAATAALIIAAMVLTVLAGFAAAKLLRQDATYGALAGAATAVCGASAALATATVLPSYRGKSADVVFVVIGVNLLSTAAMIVYPLLATMVRLDTAPTGVLIGGTIHDVAQVVGAGYAVSNTVGNNAVIVKLFRVFLLLPVTVAIGWYFRTRQTSPSKTSVPVPLFAVVFFALCLVNTAIPHLGLSPVYEPVKAVLGEASNWGLLIAISALGLGTTFGSLSTLGWRHLATLLAATLTILIVVGVGVLAGF